MPDQRTLRTLGRYLAVLYYLAGAAIIGQLAFKYYAGPKSSLDTGGLTKFPTELQGITSGARAFNGHWNMQLNFTVTDTFAGASDNRKYEDSSNPSRQPAGTDEPALAAQGRGKIQVQVYASCPKDRFSRELCLSIVPEIEVAFGPGLENIEKFLYTTYPQPGVYGKQSPKNYFSASVPKVKRVTVHIRHFNAEEKAKMIAYVEQNDFAPEQNMYIDLDYITAQPQDLLRFQVHGLVQHELVHIFQHFRPHTNSDVPPKGLIEGVADFVTLKAGVLDYGRKAPRPLSSEMRASRWDAGYADTAYFLEWLEDVRIGKGAIGKLNDGLLRVGYHYDGVGLHDETGNRFWERLFGSTVDELWEEYGVWLDKSNRWGLSLVFSLLQWLVPGILPAVDRAGSDWDMSRNFVLGSLFVLFVLPMLLYAIAELIIASYESRDENRTRHDDHIDGGDEDQDTHEQPEDSTLSREEPAQPWWFGWKLPSLFRPSAPRRKLTIFDVEGVEWEVKRVVESRTCYGKLQYRMRWVGENEDDTAWYYAQTFKHGPELLQAYHDKNPHAPGPCVRMEEWLKAARTSAPLVDHPHDNKPVKKRRDNVSDEGQTTQSNVKQRGNRTRSRRQKSRR